MDLKNPRQNPANFSHNHDCANLSTQKNVNKKKWLRIFGAGGLAFFMGVGTLCGVLIAPMGATSASNSGDPAALAQSADSALTPQEKLLAGTGLGLDPENDPVVFTTDYGLEIKYSNALTYLTGYTYFTMGSYDIDSDGVKDPVNWVIIGYDSSLKTFVGEYSNKDCNTSPIEEGYIQYSTIDDSVAGKAILSESLLISSQAVPYDTIGVGCVLCLSEKQLYNAAFSGENPAYFTDNSTYSNLRSEMLKLYNTSLGLSESQKNHIIAQELITNGSANVNDKLFPLATTRQSTDTYPVENFLATNSARSIGTSWWLRSILPGGGDNRRVCNVNHEGLLNGWMQDFYVWNSYGVRPAFVLQLYSA